MTGNNSTRTNEAAPITLPRIKVNDISCGEEHGAIVTDTGDVYTWGYGQVRFSF
jgi:alpha-tubulin suppressor-like RCC1 family protein